MIYSQPAARNVVFQRCIFHDCSRAPIQVWDYNTSAPTSTIQIKHCTFADNGSYDIDLRYHSTALIQDCVFDKSAGPAIYDPFNSAATTRDHNYFYPDADRELRADGRLARHQRGARRQRRGSRALPVGTT